LERRLTDMEEPSSHDVCGHARHTK
jgi:hypothetical protein